MWEKDHKLNFKVDIKEKLQHVNVLLAIRYDHFCPHDDIKVKVTTIQPNGQESTDDFTILLKKNGKHQGEAAANLWDLEVPITKNTNLDQIGTYEYVVENLVNEARIIAIVDVGLIIEKVEE